MESGKFGVHEVTDLREITNFKVACLMEAKARLDKVENEELKTIVEQSIEQGSTCVTKMQELLRSASTQFGQ